MILICGHLIITVTWLTLADVIFNTWFLAIQAYRWYCTRYLPTLDMLYLMHDLWHRHLVYYIGYLIHGTWYLTPALDMLYLIPDLRQLILDTGTWYMSYLSPDPDPRYMTQANPYLICFHVVQVHWLDIVTLDRTLPPLIPVLYDIFMTITFTETWHDYYIITRHFVLLNSCTPELLYTWTPEIWRLLTLLLILYSCWPL